MRRALGDGVVTGRAELRFALEAEVDTEQAVAAAEAAERALAGGDAARGDARGAGRRWTSSAGRCWPGIEGEWVRAPARRARGARAGAARGARPAPRSSIGDREHLATAERVARTLAERHPFRESGHALLIEIHGRRGNVAEATLAYDRLRVFLRDELGTVPSSAVSALHEELLRSGRLAGRAAGGAGPAARAPGAARGRCRCRSSAASRRRRRSSAARTSCERLRAAWRQASTAQRRLALLGGEAGRRQDAPGRAVRRRGPRRGRAVLYGRCEQEPLRSYQPFIEALRHELRHGGWADDPAAAGDLEELARILPEARAQRARRRSGRGARRRIPRPSATASSRPSRGSCAARPSARRCCSSSTTCTGSTARRCCCCATSCAIPTPRA